MATRTKPKLRVLGDLAIANVTWRGRASRKTLMVSIGLLYVFGALTIQAQERDL